MKVFLGGEGTTELGRFAYDAAYRDAGERGVLQVIVEALGAEVIGGLPWSKIRKARAGAHASAEARNVAGLVLHAKEHRADAVVFIRDRDRDVQRERDVEHGIAHAKSLFPQMRVAGGCAVEAIEALGLILLGDLEAESHARPKLALAMKGYETTAALCTLLETRRMDSIPEGTAARIWFNRVHHALQPDPS